MLERIKVFDFFCGCGGTSLGFKQAGMDVVFGLDIDSDAIESYKLNFPKASSIHSDIRNISLKALSKIIHYVSSPLLFCGCAPCQPFSKQNRKNCSPDPRVYLIHEFEKIIIRFRPEYIFLENVPGLQRFDIQNSPLFKLQKKLDALGYYFDFGAIPAAFFGVPQMRERLIFMASKKFPIKLPRFTHGTGKKPFSTVADWIRGLPSIVAGEQDAHDDLHKAASLTSLNLERIKHTPEGGGRYSWPEHLYLSCHKDHNGHSDVYGRLAWNKPASGLTTRCISYSNGRFGHPEQNRAISAREAALLQTFPLQHQFKGSLSSIARQIGNAVPPLMAKRIGSEFVKHYKKYCQ